MATGQIPEGAIYKILSLRKVGWLPQIYSSGILANDFLGYRLDYLLMEDCGKIIDHHCLDMFRNMSGIHSAYTDITNVISQTVACLAEAANAGVLHRDISAGNITIRDGQIRVIDWGCAKLLNTNLPGIKEVASEWGFDLDEIKENDKACNGIIGTPAFMSIRVLLGHPTRCLIDDIESLFYVVLQALSYYSHGSSLFAEPQVSKNTLAALAKVGLVANRESYLRILGIEKCPDNVKVQLDTLRQLLFCRDNQFIGGELIENQSETRIIYLNLMRRLMGNELFERVCRVPAGSSNA
ncbi:hypothetical protein IW139_001503 [Coemansia sp. RSA 353]|nr:hypothetical protein IW139_001503 [Coemansia sp. RSA 353]